jgi:hypothetical protein
MRFAHGADALQIAECRRFKPGDFFRIEVKIGHSVNEKIGRLRSFSDHRAQFGGRHAHVFCHALDFRVVAGSKIRA